ncbi:MAG TPA: hypothetical protein VN809_04945 [Telmatospirillum sp.]|nr:hypothetical protein [Telmatospirillum sp.]
MMTLSFDEVTKRYPHLAKLVLGKLEAAHKAVVDPMIVQWQAVVCHDDPEQPLDEAACADVMLTGTLPCRHGLCGSLVGHFACFCEEDCRTMAELRKS